jgi:CcmD family protein
MLRRVYSLILLGCLWVAPVVIGATQATAQDSGATSAQDDRAQSFQAVSGGVKEDISGAPLLLAAYAVVWVTLFGYVWRLNRLQRGVEANLERLERTVTRESASAR